jgi:hypothetical protein
VEVGQFEERNEDYYEGEEVVIARYEEPFVDTVQEVEHGSHGHLLVFVSELLDLLS